MKQNSTSPTLCFIHGWGAQNAVWQTWIEQYFTEYSVQLIELPGFGAAAPILTEFNPDKAGFNSCNQAWLEQISAQIPVNSMLIGWSLGGILAQQLTLRSSVAGLVCLSSTPKFVQAENWHCAIEPVVIEQFRAALQQDAGSLLKRFYRLQFQGDNQMRSLLKQFNQTLENQPQPGLVALQQGLNLLENLDLRADLAALAELANPAAASNLPSLWIFGEQDQLIPLEVANQVQKLLPSAKIARLSGCAHLPFYAEAEATAAQIKQFINNLAG